MNAVEMLATKRLLDATSSRVVSLNSARRLVAHAALLAGGLGLCELYALLPGPLVTNWIGVAFAAFGGTGLALEGLFVLLSAVWAEWKTKRESRK